MHLLASLQRQIQNRLPGAVADVRDQDYSSAEIGDILGLTRAAVHILSTVCRSDSRTLTDLLTPSWASTDRSSPNRKPIGQREGLQALVVSAKRSQAESIALLSSLGVAPR